MTDFSVVEVPKIMMVANSVFRVSAEKITS